jgi:hypothetical protein
MAGEQELLRQERDPPPEGPAAPRKVDTGPIRKSIADLARTFVRDGHYLEGTAGNTPGEADGNPGGDKRDHCKLLQPSLNTDLRETRQGVVITVVTAMQNKFKDFNSCAGRSGRSDLLIIQPPTAALNLAQLREYLRAVREKQKSTLDQTFWPGFGPRQLHPRRHHLLGELKDKNTIIWGESCVGRRHFDCVGLVNFCYEEHTKGQKVGWAFEIKQYVDGTAGTSDKGKLDPAKVLDGDIVCRLGPPQHIGLLARVGGTVFVVQAPETSKGLTDTEVYDPKNWDKCVRVHDNFLVKRKHKLKDGNGR